MSTGAYDADYLEYRLTDERAFDGVRRRRLFAFLIDYALVALLWVPAAILVGILGVLTLGLGWMLYGILYPAIALLYVARSVGGPRQATPGMRMMGIRLDRYDGQRIDGLFAVLHFLLFWGLNVVLTPFVLLASLVLDHKRTVHDLLLGTVVTRDNI
ncbi:MAG: RDD family protein [Rhizobiaceae bacterium]